VLLSLSCGFISLAGDGYVSLQHLQFTWSEIEEATNRFSREKVIDKGRFGEVYKVRKCKLA